MNVAYPGKRILILGGGFAGAYVAQHLERCLRDTDPEVALITRNNFVLFTPMLHEVAGADVDITHVVQPLRKMLRRTRVGIADIQAIDLAKKQVRVLHKDFPDPVDVGYEQLVLALGSVTNFHRIPGLQEHALTMKSLGDAIIMRNRIIDALELADNQTNETARAITLTIVVAGGGLAGAETVGAINDYLRDGMKFFPRLKPHMLRVVLVHSGEIILPELSPKLGRYAQRKLAQHGVEVRLSTKVVGYDGHEVKLDDGTRIPTRILIWTAGVTPPTLLSTLPCALKRGRVVANDCLQVPDWPGVWALGDCALIPDPDHPGCHYPPTAQHATREARVLAENIAASLRGRSPRPFKYKTLGMLAAIGRRSGVAQIMGMRFSGIVAWWLWRTIYLSKLPGFQKKVRVALDWTLDLFFSPDLVQLPTLRARTMSEPEVSSPHEDAHAAASTPDRKAA